MQIWFCYLRCLNSDRWIHTQTQNSNRKSGNLRSKKLFTFFEKLRKIDNNINVYVLMCITLYSTYPDYLIKINKPHIRHSMTQKSNTTEVNPTKICYSVSYHQVQGKSTFWSNMGSAKWGLVVP